MKDMASRVAWLRDKSACFDGLEWVRNQTSPEIAWASCKRGDWMSWVLNLLIPVGSDMRKLYVLSQCACARLSLQYVKPGDLGPLRAIETVERWARGEVGVMLDDVRAAAAAAYATSVYTAAAAYAAHAVVHASTYACVAACVAASASASAYADAAADAAYAVSTARKNMLAQCADIIRENFPNVPMPLSLKENSSCQTI